jgi:polysaccharide biosynthesis protein PslA
VSGSALNKSEHSRRAATLAGSAPAISNPVVHPVSQTALNPIFPANSRQQRVAAYRLLLVTDLLCIFLGFAAGSLVRFGDFGDSTWLRITMAVAPLFLISAMHNRAYSLEALQSVSVGVYRAVLAFVSALAVLFVISYFLKAEQDVSRLSVGTGMVVALLALAVSRNAAGTYLKRSFNGDLTSTVVITDDENADQIPGARVLNTRELGIRPEPRNPAMIQRLVRLLDGADRVVIFCSPNICGSWAAMLKGANVRGEIVANEVSAVGPVAIGRLGNHTTLVVSSRPLSAQQQFVKRGFDLIVTVPALAFLAPLMLIVAIAIKLDSPGPVLFKQQRVGFGNRLFSVYKFRSMAAATSDDLGTTSTARDDQRVTRLGRFIRSTSIDELPQLFNVLNGTMSLVGPRPHAMGSFAGSRLFWDVDDRYAHRHMLRPGITGLAQIRGLRGTAHHEDDLSRRLQSDLEYMADWSIGRDMMIIVKTFSVLAHPNAY